jgi:hypothetical protein
MINDPQAWESVTGEMLETFKCWMLQQGYAVSTVNIRLTTARVFAGLAVKAGVLHESDLPMIRFVKGCAFKEAAHIDEQRDEAGIETRRSWRRNGAVSTQTSTDKIGDEQLLRYSLTPQGQADTLLVYPWIWAASW